MLFALLSLVGDNAEKAKSRPERGGRGIPACSGLSEEKEKSSNEGILKGELFSAKNNIAYPSEKSKLFLKINKKIECIYKIAGNDGGEEKEITDFCAC